MKSALDPKFIDVLKNEYRIQINQACQLNAQDDRAVWLIKSVNQDLTIRIFDSKHSENEVTQDLNVLKFLEQHSFPAPYLLKTNEEKDYFVYKNLKIAATSYIEGILASKTPDNFSILGELTAKLHLLGENNLNSPLITESRWQPKVTIPQIIKDINELLKLPSAKKWYPTLLEMKEGLESLPYFAQLPKTLVHTDIHERNLILTGNDSGVLIDWYDAGWAPAIIDIGYVFAQSCLWEKNPESDEIQILEEYIKAFYQSYKKIRQLSSSETKGLIWAMQFGNYSYAASAVVDGAKNNKDTNEFLKSHHDWKRFKYLRSDDAVRSLNQVLIV